MTARAAATGRAVMPIHSDGGTTDTHVWLHNWCTKAKSSSNTDCCIVQFQSYAGQGQCIEPVARPRRACSKKTSSDDVVCSNIEQRFYLNLAALVFPDTLWRWRWSKCQIFRTGCQPCLGGHGRSDATVLDYA